MKKKIMLAIIALVLVSAAGYANTFSLRGNYFLPNGPSSADLKSLWNIEYYNMDFRKTAFQGGSFGFAFEYFLTRELSLEFSIEALYNKTVRGAYKDYLGFEYDSELWAVFADHDKYMDVDTFSTLQSLSVSITPIQMTLKIAPFGRRGKLIPYLGVGGGVYFWSVRMEGDVIDFNDEYVYESTTGYDVPVYPLYYPSDIREDRKVAFGYHFLGGIMLSLGNKLTLDIGAKYNVAKGKMTDGFPDYALFDLGGFQFSAGLNYWF